MKYQNESIPSLREWGAVKCVKNSAESGAHGTLSALRISFSKHGADGDDLFSLSAALLDAALFVAGSDIKKLFVNKWDAGAFILAEFENEVTAEIELNLGLPSSMPGIYFVTGYCSNGIVTNQPVAGYFNPGGVLQADENSCRTFLVDRDVCEDEIAQARCRAAALNLAPVSSAVIDLMKEYFS